MILCASLVFLAGAVVMGAAPEKVTLLVGRIIVGIGIGRAYFSVHVYIYFTYFSHLTESNASKDILINQPIN